MSQNLYLVVSVLIYSSEMQAKRLNFTVGLIRTTSEFGCTLWHCLITDQSKSLVWYLFSAIVAHKTKNFISLRMDKNYFHDYFLHFWWVIIRQWCRNQNSSAHYFVSKLLNILIRPSQCWPQWVRDLEYAITEQQGKLLMMSLELNMTENDLIL